MQRKATNDDGWLDHSPTHLVHRVAQCAGDIFQAHAWDSDLTPRQVVVLTTVARNEGLSQTGIVVRTGIDRSTLADLVRRLKKKGLLERRRKKDDARAYTITLTDEGRRALRTIEPLAKRVDDEILAALPPKDRPLLITALQAIVAKLQPPITSPVNAG
jgi:MarR family transcriptional regulator, temperature-dependent positive regulator of motility